MAITSEEKTHRLCNLEYVAMLRFLCLIDKEIINFLDYHTECWPSLSVFEGPHLCSKSIRHEKRLSKFIWQECVKRHLLRKYFRNNSTQSALSCRPSTIISMSCVSMFRFWMHALSVDVWQVQGSCVQTLCVYVLQFWSICRGVEVRLSSTVLSCPLILKRKGCLLNRFVSKAFLYHDL